MDGVGRVGKWKSLKRRLERVGCCGGATWGFRPSSISVINEEEEEIDSPAWDQHREEADTIIITTNVGQIPAGNASDLGCMGRIPAVSGMNLAAALAAERQLRSNHDPDGGKTGQGTPSRMSLVRLIEETDGGAFELQKGRGGGSRDSLCCVCMERSKGAAFIPCGHTFCRVCSRELWVDRGSCPLCNRLILEILDIF